MSLQVSRSDYPLVDVELRSELSRIHDLISELKSADLPVSRLVSETRQQTELLVVHLEPDQLEDLAQVLVRDLPLLLSEDLEYPEEVESLLLDVH